KRFADRHRSKAPTFKPGDKVFIDFRKYKTTRPVPKFDFPTMVLLKLSLRSVRLIIRSNYLSILKSIMSFMFHC
ncbi:hypothetical protein BKA69DRAFT_253221, partial [Paraphysoderma sedebokerense]